MKKIINFLKLAWLLCICFFDSVFQVIFFLPKMFFLSVYSLLKTIFRGIYSLLKEFFNFLAKKFPGVFIVLIMIGLGIHSYLHVGPFRWIQRINKVIVITFFVVAIIFAINLGFEFFNQTEPLWFLFGCLASFMAFLYFGFQSRKEFY